MQPASFQQQALCLQPLCIKTSLERMAKGFNPRPYNPNTLQDFLTKVENLARQLYNANQLDKLQTLNSRFAEILVQPVNTVQDLLGVVQALNQALANLKNPVAV